MYSTLIEHLQSIQCLSILMATPEYKPELSCAAAMFGVIEATMHAAGATADQTAHEQHHGKDSLAPVALNWSHVTGFLPLIGGCLTKWVKEILDCDPSPTLQVCQIIINKFTLHFTLNSIHVCEKKRKPKSSSSISTPAGYVYCSCNLTHQY